MSNGGDRLSLPAEHAAEIAALGNEVLAAIEMDLDLARSKANDQYEAIREAERATGRTLHKGAALHNMGVVWLGTNEQTAMTYFVAAYAEDARTYGSDASRTGAASALRDLYLHQPPDLARIAFAARKYPTVDPLHLATDIVGSDNGSALLPMRLPPVDEDRLPAAEQCVFAGGTYRNGGWSSIYTIRKAVETAGLTPVIVRDVEGRGRRDLEKSLALLDHCGLVILDITPTGGNQGWQPELARLSGSSKPLLALHHDTQIDRDWGWPGMLPDPATLNLTSAAYDTPPRERAIVIEWLGRTAPVRHAFPQPFRIVQSGGSAALGIAGTPQFAKGSNSRFGDQ